MAQERYQTPDGKIYEALPGGGYAEVTDVATDMPYTIGTPDPAAQYEAPRAAVDLQTARAKEARDAIAFAERNKPTLPAGYMMGPNGTAVRVPGLPAEKQDNKADQEKSARVGKLQSLAQQIRRVRQLYDANIAPTSGLAGIADYLPSETNRQFDTAGAGLAEQGLAAFRVPGVGAQSDTELRQFTQANKPQAGDYDIQIEEKLRQLQLRTDSELQSLGQKPIDWNAQQPTAPAFGGPQQPQQQAAIPGARGPNYYDPGTGPGGPTLNGGGGTQRVADPTKAGVAARLNQLLKSGAPDAKVREYAASVGASPESLNAVLAFRKQNPGYTGNYNASDLELKNEDIGLFRGAVNSAAQSGVGAYFLNAADGLTAGTLDNMADNPALARAGLAGVRQAQPGASLLGTISGSALGAGAAELGLARAGLTAGRAALAGDALYGAAYGAGSADEGNRFLGAGVGATGGVLGGIGGRALARGIGGTLTGVRNADVQGLRAAGVPLTVGQAAGESGVVGNAVKGIEDRLSGLPVVGDIVNARRAEGFQGFNRAAFDEGLAPIGANTGGTIAEPGIDAALAARSAAYRDALDPVTLKADDQFIADMQGVLRSGEALPDPMRGNAAYTLNTRIGNSFSSGSPIQRVGENDGWSQYVYQSTKGDIPFEVMPPARGRQGIEIAIDENNVSGANRLGIRELREAASHLRSEYPNAQYVYGTRTTGAGPGRVQDIDLSAIPIAENRPGIMQGTDFQQAIRGLRRDSKAVASQPYGYDFGQVASQGEKALNGLLSRQAPDALPAYNAANAANRNVEILRDAVNRARNGSRSGEVGTFTPSQLADAAAANAKKFGNSQGTTRQPFFDLSRAGQRVLPSTVPDSGTAGRAVVAGGLGLAGLGGGAGYAAGDAKTGAGAGLLGAAALAFGGSKLGQRALTAALLDRPDVLIRLGEGVQRKARIGGLFGAPMLAGGAVSLSGQ